MAPINDIRLPFSFDRRERIVLTAQDGNPTAISICASCASVSPRLSPRTERRVRLYFIVTIYEVVVIGENRMYPILRE